MAKQTDIKGGDVSARAADASQSGATGSARVERDAPRPASSAVSAAAAGAIGMDLAMQSGAGDGMAAFAATSDLPLDGKQGDAAPVPSDASASPEDTGPDAAPVDTDISVSEPEDAADEAAEAVAEAVGTFVQGYGGAVTSLGSLPVASGSLGVTEDTRIQPATEPGSWGEDAAPAPGPEADAPSSGLVGGLIGDGGVVDDLLGEDGLVDDLLDDLLGEGGAVQGVITGVLGDGGLVDGLLGAGGLLDGIIDYDSALGSVVEVVVGDNGLLGLIYGDDSLVVSVTEGLLDGLVGDDGLVDGLLDGLAGGGGLLDSVSDVLSGETGVVEGVVGGVLGEDGLVGSVVDGVLGEDGLVGSLLDGVVGENGLLGGLVGDEGPLGGLLGGTGLLAGTGGLLGGAAEDEATGETVVDEVDAFVDTLVSGGNEDGLGLAPDLLDGLLGDEDVFGIDAGAPQEALGDIFAGLDGLGSLSGSLVTNGIVETLVGGEGEDSDPEIDTLLNDLLGDGTSEILGGSAAFDALLGEASAPDGPPSEAGEEGGLLGDTAIDNAIGTLFGSVEDLGGTLIDGLLPGAGEDDAV